MCVRQFRLAYTRKFICFARTKTRSQFCLIFAHNEHFIAMSPCYCCFFLLSIFVLVLVLLSLRCFFGFSHFTICYLYLFALNGNFFFDFFAKRSRKKNTAHWFIAQNVGADALCSRLVSGCFCKWYNIINKLRCFAFGRKRTYAFQL